MVIENQRHLFDIPENISYLNCAYMSPLLKSAERRGHAGLLEKATPWDVKPIHLFDDSEKVRDLFARLIGANADCVALVPSVSYGAATAGKNLKLNPSQNIVVLAEQFPSNVYPWLDLAKETGAKVIQVPRPENFDWTSAILDTINSDTALVALANCHWTDGSLIKLKEVRKRTREVGAQLFIDATQSLGAYPLDIKEVDPDYLVCVGYKWLLGPYTLGYLYVSPEHQNGNPVEHNWIARIRSEDFSQLIRYRDEFQPGARRFDMGERSNPILIPMAIAALEQILEWGVDNIAETLGESTKKLSMGAKELGLEPVPSDKRVNHLVGLRFEREIRGLAEKLAEKRVYVSLRGNSIRMAPHLYNDDNDLDRFFESVKACL